MKRLLLIVSFFVSLIVIVLVCYGLLQASREVLVVADVLDEQIQYEEYYTSYGYTLDDANVIVDPYGLSPLTALIIFETDHDVDVNVSILNLNGEVDLHYMASSGRVHYIPVVGLYENHDNEVILQVGDVTKKFVITTSDIEYEFNNDSFSQGQFRYYTDNKNSWVMDSLGNVRWFLKGYGGNLSILENGHFLLGDSSSYDDDSSLGVVDIDYLGKIYYRYLIDGGFDYRSLVVDNRIYVLSNGRIVVLSKQSGEVLFSREFDDVYYEINEVNGLISVCNEKDTIGLDRNTYEEVSIGGACEKDLFWDISFPNEIFFQLGKGKLFGQLGITETSSDNVSLFRYSSLGNKAKEYDISIYEENEQLVVLGNLSSPSYVVLDSGLSKKIYLMEEGMDNFYKYIHKEGISGKYSIYMKFDGKVYSTDYYIDW